MENYNLIIKSLFIFFLVFISCHFEDSSKTSKQNIDGHWYLVDISGIEQMNYIEMKIFEHKIISFNEGLTTHWQESNIDISLENIFQFGSDKYKIISITNNSFILTLEADPKAKFYFRKLIDSFEGIVIEDEIFRKLAYDIKRASLKDTSRIKDLKHMMWNVLGGAVNTFEVDEIINK